MKYPKEIENNLLYRVRIIERMQDDEFACLIKEYAMRDVLYFFNVYLWTYDPRGRGRYKDLPFVTWEYQDEYILGINDGIEIGEDIFTDKSRDMGVTWMKLGVILWRFLSKRGEDYLLGSRKEEYVDTGGNMSTHFEKVRYMLRRLPKIFLPDGFDWGKHSNYMRIKNPDGGGIIVGEATNANFGRGGRFKAVMMDEFQNWENDDAAYRSVSDSTNCKMILGTPQGMGNKFAELKRTSEIRRKYNLMWWLHPHKTGLSKEHIEMVERGGVVDKVSNYLVQVKEVRGGIYIDQYGKKRSEWYDKECDERGRDDIAENLDCSYLTSGRPYFDMLKCEEGIVRGEEPKFIGNLEWVVEPQYNQGGECINEWDLDVEFRENRFGEIQIWEKPIDGYEDGYVISADIAEGLEQGDYSSARVLKRMVITDESKPEVVAKIWGKYKEPEFAEMLAKLGVYYKMAYIGVERNKTGSAVIMQLFRMYKKQWHKDVITRGYPEITDKIGFETSNQHVKNAVCAELSKAISENSFIDKDEGFWRETMTFVNNDGRLEAMGKSQGQKCYDDQVMAEAILWWIHNRMPVARKKIDKGRNDYEWKRYKGNMYGGNLIGF